MPSLLRNRLSSILLILLGLALLALAIWFGGPYVAFATWVPLESNLARLTAIALMVVMAGLSVRLRQLTQSKRRVDATSARTLKKRRFDAPAISSASPTINPYVGPRPFERDDKARFFGREREARYLLNKIYSHSVVLLYAQSGCGKTSLLNARVLDDLEQDGIDVLPMARIKRVWPPGVALHEVENVYTFNILLGWHDDSAGNARHLAKATLLEGLGTRFPGGGDGDPRVLVIDQFEEVFTTYPDRWRDRRPFFEQLGALVAAHPTMRLVLAMREDYLALLDSYSSLLSGGQWSRVRLEQLRQREAIEAVTHPLRESGRTFANGVAEELVADLAQVQSRMEHGETGTVEGEFVEPVQLQVVCAALWDHLPPGRFVIERSDLKGFGDVDLALAAFYENALDWAIQETGADEKTVREWVQEHLITSVGTRGMVMEGQDNEVAGILAALEAARLIRAEWRHGARWFELTHDRFIAPIRASNLAFVSFENSQLAGLSRRLDAAGRFVGYATAAVVVLIAALSVLALPISYSRNRAYLDTVAADLEALRRVPPVPAGSPPEAVLARLDAVRVVVDSARRFGDRAPWAMRWGLYQADSIGNSARDAYERELYEALVPQLAARFRQRLIEYAAEPETLYEYLKGYLMLGDPSRLDRSHLEVLADQEWLSAYPAQPDTAVALGRHFRSLLESQDRPRSAALDQSIVAQSRNTLKQASQAGLAYRYLNIAYADDTTRALRLDVAAGLGVDRVLRRRSGRSLSEPVSSIYTKSVFEEITNRQAGVIVRQMVNDNWVWGDTRAPTLGSLSQLSSDVVELYENDYIDAWERIVNDIRPFQAPSLDGTKEALAILSGSTSPLRGLLKVVDENTFLVDPKNPASQSGVSDRVASILGATRERLNVRTVVPGARVTAHFDAIHRLVIGDGGSAQIDSILRRLDQIGQDLSRLERIPTSDPTAAQLINSIRAQLRSLETTAASLPPFLRSFLIEVANLVRRETPPG